MVQKLVILKIGGSVLTEKERSLPEIRTGAVTELGKVLAKRYDPAYGKLILVHGAGSFGHIHAQKHGLVEGTKNHPEKLLAALENQALDGQLNAELTKLFLSCGLPVSGMPTRSLATNARGELAHVMPGVIACALEKGAIPLLHGDMVFDTEWGLSVCSGDELTARLSEHFGAESVFFASDVDGIFTSDPHLFPEASLIPEASFEELRSGSLALGRSHHRDVTGGLSKKFSFFAPAPSLRNIYLFNGLRAENFAWVFDQTGFRGTRIRVS